jgi:hypothetical protein
MNLQQFDEMIGKTITSIDGCRSGSDLMSFKSADGHTFKFLHYQDCCERVQIEDVCGDVEDLLRAPIVIAEEVSEPEPYAGSDDSYTWTFYRFATAKGTVTIRWLGESNGYYSESVEFEHLEPSED